MVTFEEFGDIVDEITATMPEEFFRELNGGVFVRESLRLHPEGRNGDLVIMGEYCVRYDLGRFIILYYGSFEKVHGYLPEERLRKEIRRVILHEFRHHLESLAGERDLEIEDALTLARYKEGLHSQEGQAIIADRNQ
mgnify:CR=1 FL=1